jgi:hypothetical protein
MSEIVSRLPSRFLNVSGIAAALVLTAVSVMLHGSAVGARLQGPSGWTSWVTLDLMLAGLPILVPAISFVVLMVAGLDRRSSGAIALAIWLASAFGSCVLAALWI